MARSGLALAKTLKELGAKVFVSDLKDEKILKSETNELKKLKIDFETGEHSPKLLQEKDYLVLSPGVPGDIPIVKEAEFLGLPVFSEIEVAYWLCPAEIVAITGSNGKTTTTTLMREILKKAGRKTWVAGNIGVAFSGVLSQITSEGIVVLEVSSFQLEKIQEFKPRISAILNLSPDHLDRYPNVDSYIQAKFRIFENQDKSDFAVLNYDDLLLRKKAAEIKAPVLFFSTSTGLEEGAYIKDKNLIVKLGGKEKRIIDINQIGIKGPHNLSNAACTSLIATILGVKPETIAEVLKEFKGVEHRLEPVAEINGIKFINDSKATNVDSVWYALQSVANPIILIAGGKDKGGDFSKLASLVKDKVKLLILIGQAKEKIKSVLGSLTETVEAQDLAEAVQTAYKKAQAGDAVLLSPACASFDMFLNFEERGKVFKQEVAKLK
ncbi:MAG: UDP-N-acetylmuramoylalanine--D-glutamate ligase [candidate division Zixibacteria bacterium RBG_19FT_COMBO_42_43]|nr:MAG: UDP-N-acetylmuramoylalanine--D-glutamate ligase [candidate division Zixibacteria bacterium RBG_19FT_COMBO_42_43]